MRTAAPSPVAPAPAPEPAPRATAPRAPLIDMETLWLQVGGTLCNLACTHCFVSCSPTNHTHEPMTLEQVRRHVAEAAALGVKEYYFTGGEPFLNRELESMLALVVDRYGPATVLTNGMLLDPARCARLRSIADAGEYALDLRISLDAPEAEANDAIRGPGSFARAVAGIRNLQAVGIDPVLTATAGDDGLGDAAPYFALLRELGIDKPRLKLLPRFRIGAEATRGGAYASWQRLARGDAAAWDHLQCSSSRMATAEGVWCCPILVNEPTARMGEVLADALGAVSLDHPACWTCHVHGVSCRT